MLILIHSLILYSRLICLYYIIIIRIQCINVVNQLLTNIYYLPLNQYLYLSSDYKLFYLYIFIHNKYYVRLTELL